MKKIRFELMPEHIKLARRLNIEGLSTPYLGAPVVDPKRPYGNSSIIEDIAEIIGLELFEDADGEKHLSKIQEDYCIELHCQMEKVLRVILTAGSFEPGIYEAEEYIEEWKFIGDKD